MRPTLTVCLLIFVVCTMQSAAQEDALAPPGPPGSAQSRMKTLNEIEPRSVISSIPITITNPGAYVVIGNLLCTNNGNGIIVQANDVTIDLNGFTLIGSSNSQNAIIANGSLNHLYVRNGTIRGWGVSAVSSTSGRNCRYEDILATSNGFGDTLPALQFGTNTVATRCVAANNFNIGCSIGPGSKIENCAALQNQNTGLLASRDCVVKGSTFFENAMHGVYSMDNCLISDCLAVSNTGIGFYLGWNSSVSDCAAAYNGSKGFYAGRSSTVMSSSAIGNGSDGFIVYHGAVISHCSAYRNGGHGISAFADASIHRCTASENSGDGFSAGGGSCVNDCLAVLHTNLNAAGIRLTTGSTAARNTCRNNYYGIYAASHCSATDNHLVQNTNGIFANLTGAFVIRNQASGSTVTNYSLGAAVMYGPVVSGSGVITNSNPFANLSQ